MVMSIFSRRMSSLIANDVRSVRLPSGLPGNVRFMFRLSWYARFCFDG